VISVEQYDVLIVGSDIGALSAALFLARKMRRIAVFAEKPKNRPKSKPLVVTIEEGKTVTFRPLLRHVLPGFEVGGLFYEYLKICGLDKDLHFVPVATDTIVAENGTLRSRMNRFEQFRTYLVRYYQKERDSIVRFFEDMRRHAEDIIQRQKHMLTNTDYTISTLMIEWGDYSLSDLLDKYFSDETLKQEFSRFSPIAGLDQADIGAYSFFLQFAIGMLEGFGYLFENDAELVKMLLARLEIISPNIVQSRSVKEYVADETGKIVRIVDSDFKEVSAKQIICSDEPDHFYTTYFSEKTIEREEILRHYPKTEQVRKQGTLAIVLKQTPSIYGLTESSYRFEAGWKDHFAMTTLLDYAKIDPAIASQKQGALWVEYVTDSEVEITAEAILERLYTFFPKLEKAVLATTLGEIVERRAVLSQPDVRKGLSINDQIAIENGTNIQVFDNLHLIGGWMRPEADLFGQIHAGITAADIVEEKLYYGEDDDSFYYLTNDEIMMMLRHNYGSKPLGTRENHLNIHVGKSTYFIRTKAKNISIHRGAYPSPDLEIYTTNDNLSNLLLKKVTFEEVLKGGSFRYVGTEAFLYDFVNSFQLDDYKEEDKTPQVKSKIYFLSVKFLFIYLGIWALVAFLNNYIHMLWLSIPALLLTAGFTYLRYRIYHVVSWFEIVINALLFINVGFAIFWPAYNQWHNDDIMLGIMGGLFLFSWVFDRPIVYLFHRFDFRKDYASSSLFKVITNGLTLVWSLIFIGILVMTYVAGVRYVSAIYNLVFLGYFLTYFYPVLYVRTNIKK